MKIATLLKRIYYQPKYGSAYSSPAQLKRTARELGYDITMGQIKHWLRGQAPYTMHHSVRRRFARQRTFVSSINELIQIDLANMTRFSKVNRKNGYILVWLDTFSKLAKATPVKNKKPQSIIKALGKLLDLQDLPVYIMSDAGGEFRNKRVKAYLDKLGIHFYTGKNEETKASMAERWIRSLKPRLYTYFTAKDTTEYLDILPDIVKGYNNAYHRSIKMKPAEVTLDHVKVIRERLYGAPSPNIAFKFNVGDTVRISVGKKLMDKGFTPNYTEELFTIDSRFKSDGFPQYKLREHNGDLLLGSFYNEEVLRMRKSDAVYRIENIIKTRGRGKKRMHYVHWAGYPKSYDSWVRAADLVKAK